MKMMKWNIGTFHTHLFLETEVPFTHQNPRKQNIWLIQWFQVEGHLICRGRLQCFRVHRYMIKIGPTVKSLRSINQLQEVGKFLMIMISSLRTWSLHIKITLTPYFIIQELWMIIPSSQKKRYCNYWGIMLQELKIWNVFSWLYIIRDMDWHIINFDMNINK